MLVIVHTLDDINLSRLQTVLSEWVEGSEIIILTFGHCPFPGSLNQVVSASVLMRVRGLSSFTY